MATHTSITRGKPSKGRTGPGARGAKRWHGQRLSPTSVGSLAREYTEEAIKTLAAVMRDRDTPAMSKVAAAKVLLDRGWGKPSETHRLEMNGERPLMKVINEIVHVHETREQVEFRDRTPLLEITPEDDNGTQEPPESKH